MEDFLGKFLMNWRIKAVLPFIQGSNMDLGCGLNVLSKKYYKNSVGVDVFDWGEVDFLVKDSLKLPFVNSKFYTITIIAALNHIVNRQKVIFECNRVLKKNGRLIITMINPSVGQVWHKLRGTNDLDQKLRKASKGEKYGLTSNEIIQILINSGFKLTKSKRFMLGLNNLYIFKKIN
jgi:ubiquinone/menaquinone biosynthesis C-methylase UbiE